MGRARDISKVFSTSTSLSTDSEVSGSYLTLASASTTYQTRATAGLTWIATTDFAQGSTGVSLNNVFTSSYRNYKIIVSNIGGNGATQNLRFRLRKNGTDNSSSIYYIQYLSATSTTVAANRVSTQSSWNIGDVRDQGPMASIFDVLCPQISTQKTNLINTSMTNSTSEPILYFAVQTHDLTGSSADFDGFSIYPASGNMYGYVSVYGYKE